MRFAISVAALAGAALAAPHAGRPHKNEGHVVVEVTTVVKTVYVTEGYEVSTPTPTPSPVYEAPVYDTPEVTSSPIEYEAPPPAPTPVYEAPVEPTPVYEAPVEPTPEPAPPAPEPTPEAPAPAPAPNNSGYMGVVNEWRAKMGMKALAHDSKLESNAMDTVKSSNGEMIHKLNAGSFAQVLAPGEADNFEHVFVGGWLCEIPSLPGLGSAVCDTQSIGWTYQGQTGHAEILASENYSKIGCALSSGIWCCDLA